MTELTKHLLYIVPLLMVLVFFNGLISKDIYDWVLSTKKKIYLLLLVWLLPVVGFFLANKFGDLGWFSKKKGSGGQSSAITQGFLEADAVFNPGVKHRVEVMQKEEVAFQQEYGQADDVDKDKKNTD